MVKRVKKTKEVKSKKTASNAAIAEKPKVETVVVEEVAVVAESMEKPAVTEDTEKPTEATASGMPAPEMKEEKIAEEPLVEKPLEEKITEEIPMQEEQKKPEEPFISMDEPKSKLPVILLFLSIVIVTAVIAGGGMFLYLQIKDNKMSIPHIPNLFPKPTVAVTPTSIPTPTTVDITKYSIKVLNGSGVSGAAAGAKSILTAAGFTVLATDNASTSDYIKTIIATKKDIDPNYVQKLKDTLQKTYVLGDTTTLSDIDAKTNDVIITIGSQKQ